MKSMRAWIKQNGLLQWRDVPEPAPRSDEIVVAAGAISLNRGEIRMSARAADGAIPGWDVAGTVVACGTGNPAGPGPAGLPALHVGARVVALVNSGAWAERVCVPVWNAAIVPDDVPLTVASTLPIAGLTVIRALDIAGSLLGKRALITGKTGGVGMLALQLAKLAGATVDGVRTCEEASGQYDFILESVGGASLSRAVELIAPDGVIVTMGNSEGADSSFNARTLFAKSGARIHGLLIFEEIAKRRAGGRELGQLLELVRTGALKVEITERSWRDLDEALVDLEQRRVTGKIVLSVPGVSSRHDRNTG